jgi:Fe-S-cluster containining protein
MQLLWQNVDGFFDRFSSRHGRLMSCAPGCCGCCMTRITVFVAEAVEIVEWFADLDPGDRSGIRARWERADAAPGPDAAGVTHPPCTFLAAGECTVYPVRPIICRTQGLPLLFVRDPDDDEKTMDVCPLNFQHDQGLPPAAEWLELDRLNALLGLAAQSPRWSEHLADLRDRADGDGRVSLAEIGRMLDVHPFRDRRRS